MLTATTKSPPLLENNVELQLLLKELSEKKDALSTAQKQVDEKTKEIQQSCTHPGFIEERQKTRGGFRFQSPPFKNMY